MFSSKNIQMNERKNGSKVTRYAIKKLSMGTASVAVALGFMFVQGQTIVHADTVEATTAETTAKTAEEKKDTVEDDKAIYEVAVEKAEATTAAEGVTPSEKTEATTAAEGVTPAEKTEETTAAAEKKEETTAATEKAEETTAAAEKKEETTAATEKAEETTAAPEKKEETTVAEENKPRTRSRRAVAEGEATPASDDTVGEDVVDATSTPKVEKPGFTPKILAEQLLKQVSWLDFGDKANWTGAETTADGKLALQVGATYTKEVMPGYIVKIKVKSLKPFQATEIYKKRLEERGATDEEKATYDPNAKNGYINSIGDATTRKAFNNKEEAKVIADPQNRWTEIRKEGIDTGNKQTTISSEFNGGNIGVQFDVSATYNGKAVKPAIVMADGESANPGELVLFTTNGSGWQHVGEWLKNNNKNTKNYIPQNTADLFDPSKNYGSVNVDGVNFSALNLNLLRRATGVGEEGKTVAWKYYGSADLKTGGLGTGVFGPNVSASTIAVPMVMTRGASEIGLYIASSGKQSAMLGFLPLDEGDAPDSYGIATHAMNQVNGVTGAAVNQPYLGDTRPDMDENLERTDWKGDDKDGTGDEGINQILPADLKGNTNGMIALERTRPGNYTLTVQANTGGAPEAYAYAWVDFNQNGKFDENERSEKATITKDGNVTLQFNNGPILSDLQLDKLGVRVRVSTYAPDIESPTGMSMSGEVEDFETQVIFPPKGSKKETVNLQGVKQTATVEFTAQGKQRYSRTEDAVIDETVEPFIVDENGQKVELDAEGYYVVNGEGKYRVTSAGKDVKVEFIPDNGFVGTATGITIRRLDNNAVDTGWNTKDNSQPVISDQTNTMDGRYIPTVTPLSDEVTSEDLQGIEHDKQLTFTNGAGEVKPSAATPMVIVNPETGGLIGNEAPAMKDGKVVGLYEIDPINGTVKFTPNKDFIGTPDPILIQVVDEATGRTLAGIKYTPTVNPVTPVGENKETTGKQGQPQSETVTFKQQDGAEAKVPMVVNAENPAKFIDPATGEPTDATELPAMKDGKQVGTYTIDPATGKVTFTPNKDFVGTPDAISVQAKDANGTPATAKYTPTVTGVTPTGEDKTTTGKQGQTQKETPKFTEGDSDVPMKIDADQPAKFIDPETGEPTDETTLPAMKDGKQVGTYTIDPLTGEVTFTPNKDFVGTPDGISVQAKDANGTPATAKYTPTVTPVTPTAEDVESTGKQGQEQKQTPKFTEGDPVAPITISADNPAKFIDPETGEPTDATELPAMKDGKQVGTYTINPNTGEVTFKPNKDFVGTPDEISVQAKDANGTPATAKYTPTVTGVTPTGEDKTTTGKQGQTQKETPKFTEGDSDVPMKIDADQPAKFIDPETGEPTDETTLPAMKDGKQVGTYTIDPLTGEVTFTPNKDFVGTPDGISVQAKDANGTPATAKYTPTVTPVTPTAEDVESTGKQGQEQKQTPKFTEGDPVAPITISADNPAKFIDPETGEPTDETTLPAMKDGKQVGTYTIDPLTGEVTFTPNKDFVGTPDGISVQAKDVNGTPATAKYTPTVTPVTPTAEDVESTGKQGQEQKQTPKFTEGDPVAPITISADNPAKFIDPETGEPTDATELPAMKDGKQVGTYTIDPLTGEVTFKPNKDFVGTPEGITVQAKDANGTPATATYTPTVTPVTPTGENKETTGKQGQPQSDTVTFKQQSGAEEKVPMVVNAENPAKFIDPTTGEPTDATELPAMKDGKQVGTYTIDPATGKVTFTPNKDFVGTPEGITVQAKDANGTPATAKYTPTVTAVTPTGEDKTTTGKQGQVQKETPKFTEGDSEVPMKIDADQPAKFIDPVTGEPTDETTLPAMKDGKQVGTYTIDPTTGEVTFTPNKDFVGTPEGITVQAKDANGTPATAKYTPTVTAVTPTGEDKTTTGKQGQVQKETPKFTEGDSEVPMKIDADQPAKFIDPATGEPTDATELPAMKDGKQVGTYKLDPLTGEVTFTPNKDFVGTPDAITVQAKDANGTAVTATYTPTVTPVTPTAEDAETTNVQGKTQTAKPKFTEGDSDVPLDDTVPATFEDGSTTKVIPGVGTFTVAPDGTITFVPEPNFTGVAPAVTIQRVDVNGTVVKANYVATVTPVTPTGEDKTTTGKQGQVQKETPKFTEGDSEVPMKIDADQPAKFIDPATGEPTDATELPAMKDGKQVGTYKLDPLTGEVTFTPNKDFVGTPEGITVQAKDANGTPATAKYTPTVTPVTPTAEDAETTDVQGKTQTAKPKFTEGDSDVPLDDTVPATFEDGSTTKVIPGVGTFTVAPDGTITFVPEPNFTGVAPAVTIQRVDVNGTVVKANYVATVTPAPAKPVEVEPATTTPEPAKPQQELPNTGTSDEYGVFSAAALSILASVGLVATSRKKDEEQEA